MNKRVVLLAGLVLLPASAKADPDARRGAAGDPLPVVPSGYVVEIHAAVTDPVRMSFGPSGVLYTGRDNSGSGGDPGDAVRIHRVTEGGVAAEYGDVPIVDPDAVIVDTAGQFAPAGSVLVGGQVSNEAGGHISAVRPDLSVVALFATTAFHNPTDFCFDSNGRLLFTNFANAGTSPRGVYVSTGVGDVPSALFTTSVNVAAIAVDASNRIFVSAAGGSIRLHAADGTEIDDAFVTGLGSGAVPFALGELGDGPTSLWVANASGSILRIDMQGNSTPFGSGFLPSDLEIRDGVLYVSELQNDRVLRVSRLGTEVGEYSVREAALALSAYPNPSPSGLLVALSLPRAQSVRITAHDVAGRTVATLYEGFVQAGSTAVAWGGRDDVGRRLGSGVYVIRLDAADGARTRKIQLLR